MDLSALAEPGRHQPLLAANGMVATSQPLAAAAGLRVLQEGGSAADAAIAMAACLTVVEPCSNGIGSDAFALVWDGTRLHGLNGSGRAPSSLTADRLRDAGHATVPLYGWDAVTVPGTPRAWADLHARFGRLPFERLLEPAAAYAEEGFPVSPVVAWGWRGGVERAHAGLAGEPFDEFLRVFAPDGAAPAVGERWRSPDHAATLREIAATRAGSFYEGDLAERIAAHAARTGGHLTAADLAGHRGEWVEPISTDYRGYDVWEIPPNGQGIAALMALNILEEYDLAALRPVSVQAFHLGIEAIKLALTDTLRHVADPARAEVPTAELLSKDYAARRRRLIGHRALAPEPGDPRGSDTVYLCAADSSGMMVSFIQSNFHGFGSHVVVPGTGIALQNRGHGFSLEPSHPNELEPGKRPFHTIIPGFLTRDGAAIGPFGVMGGHMQAQGHVQLVLDTVDHGLDPQSALDQPRWIWVEGRSVLLESAVGGDVLDELAVRGHDVAFAPHAGAFGRGQAIWQLGNGVHVGGTESRADGAVLGW
ncbi:MAG: gamma-glutamyltransferase family protein [Actinomycetota bacterium]